MEEDSAVKAPVTRLRRRLSVEVSDETKPSSAPSTPTKKRGGRLATKPQLELIDEDAPQNNPKRATRKSIARDTIDQAEEKVPTPSRRSARVKSNTSIVLDTVEAIDSPRAKRAARRTSQIGSDNEAPSTPVKATRTPARKTRKDSATSVDIAPVANDTPVKTPGRATRRTRKDSASSVDKQDEVDTSRQNTVPEIQSSTKSIITEVIAEEAETELRKSVSNEDTSDVKSSPDSVRKSPRLIEKQHRKSINDDNTDHTTTTTSAEKNVIINGHDTSLNGKINKTENVEHEPRALDDKLSSSSTNLIKDLDSEPKTKSFIANQSMSAIDDNNSKTKRQRTKSWTTLSTSQLNDASFNSDNEITKKNLKKHGKVLAGSGDGVNVSATDIGNKSESPNTSLTRQKTRSESSFIVEKLSVSSGLLTPDKSGNVDKSFTETPKVANTSNESNKENIQESVKLAAELLFKQSPGKNLKSNVFIEDSDSNTDVVEQPHDKQITDIEDQCVPQIIQDNATSTSTVTSTKMNAQNESFNIFNRKMDDLSDTCEPMDVDVTIPVNVSLNDSASNFVSRKSLRNSRVNGNDSFKSKENDFNEIQNKSSRKSSLCLPQENIANDNLNKSKRKSTLNESRNDKKSENEQEIIQNQSSRKSSLCLPQENISNDNLNKSKRKSTSNESRNDKESENDQEIIQNKSSRKSSLCLPQENIANDNLNKSKRKSTSNESRNDSKSENDPEIIQNKSSRKSSLCLPQENITNDNLNKSKRKSTLNESRNDSKSENDQEIIQNKRSRNSSLNISPEIENNNKSKRKSSLVESINQNNLVNEENGKQNKSARKSSLSITQEIDSSAHKSCNKSKRKSASNSIDLEKSGNENKSTLVLSQLKDVSSTEHNTSESLHESNTDLSKSMQNIANEVKINQSKLVNYSTSTPVHQKASKKLAKQINTSEIKTKAINENESSSSKNKDSSNCDSTDESKEDLSLEKNDMIDDEAEEASDDYESGDSQDESERRYEKEHEIIDKGETLTSEEDISDDSEYEKDSFVLSSDEEDDELLSGTGDDLNMSDNELTMSAKSKKKYDERSRKQQKNASRDMFESRHKLNNSDKITKGSKNKSNPLDSTQESDTEIIAPPKKNKRMRLDSNWDSTATEENISKLEISLPISEANEKKKKNKSLTELVNENQDNNDNKVSTFHNTSMSGIDSQKGKKTKRQSKSFVEEDILINDNVVIGSKSKKSNMRLSESISNNSAINEKEITICNASMTEKVDPLSQLVKKEPKMPQNDFDISTINFTVREELEQVNVNENTSIIKSNDVKDPLQATIAEEFSENSSISENEEIMREYDSILDNLNKADKKKIKNKDFSLNLDNKKVKKINQPIINELNITQNKNKKTKALEKEIIPQEEDSNNSTDIKLLLSEDSHDNDIALKKQKTDSQEETFIPLKRTEAKTNISLNVSNTSGNQSLLNTSSKKKKKKNRKSSQNENSILADEVENIFFVDKVGARVDDPVNGSLNISSKKNKKLSISLAKDAEVASVKDDASQQSDDSPIEILFTSEKAKNKNDSVKETSVVNTSISKKKKKLSESMNVDRAEVVSVASHNLSLDSKKLQKKVTPETTVTALVNAEQNDKTNQYSKNDGKRGQKRKRDASTDSVQDDNTDKCQEVKHIQEQENSKKKKKMSTNEEATESVEKETKKKSKKRKRDDNEIGTTSKILKTNSLDKVIPRLPPTIINQLEEKPRKDVLEAKKLKIVSTTDFLVEETKKRKNKPSNYLEESVYLNADPESPVQKKKIVNKKPKVLPFTPTASTSDSGFTTKFQVNVIPQKVEFTAQSVSGADFKSNYLNDRRIKKLRTYDLYKHHRHIKLSKF